MKKIAAMLLCAVLFLAALPVGVLAEDAQPTQAQQITKEAEAVYKKCLRTANKESFAGFCGLMTSHQLYNMGINDTLIVQDGNKQYDYYKNLELTTGGYYVKPYSATDYSLFQALNTISQNGNRDVYNLLVGFQWTDTEAGGIYGHAVLINAILDGTVYFVESFNYCFGKLSCKEGKMLTCSIKEFADYFDSWTRFEGIIYFGQKQYSAACQNYGTDVFLRTRFASQLRSQPCLVGENDCQRLRTLAAGEVLHATAVCKNTQGELFYRIAEGTEVGYISANAVSLLQVNTDSMTLNGDIPLQIAKGKDIKLKAEISAGCASVSQIGLTVTGGDGQALLETHLDTEGTTASLELLNENLDFATLPEGSYLLTVWAGANHVLVKETGFTSENPTVTLLEQSLVVGTAEPAEEEPKEQVKDGWFFENGTWYCYSEGAPCTGWVTRFGVDYFLQEDGSVTTGWQEEDGWLRYFSACGALCNGWTITDRGLYYWISDGVYATGEQTIDGKQYLFGEDGIFIEEQ